MPIGSRVTQKISREPLKKSAFCYLGIVTEPKRSLHTKNHAHTTATELMGLKGLTCETKRCPGIKLIFFWSF